MRTEEERKLLAVEEEVEEPSQREASLISLKTWSVDFVVVVLSGTGEEGRGEGKGEVVTWLQRFAGGGVAMTSQVSIWHSTAPRRSRQILVFFPHLELTRRSATILKTNHTMIIFLYGII